MGNVKLRAAENRIEAIGLDGRAPLPDHDNHHNALRCPYCNPKQLALVDHAEIDRLRAALLLIHGQSGDDFAHDIAEARAIAGAALTPNV